MGCAEIFETLSNFLLISWTHFFRLKLFYSSTVLHSLCIPAVIPLCLILCFIPLYCGQVRAFQHGLEPYKAPGHGSILCTALVQILMRTYTVLVLFVLVLFVNLHRKPVDSIVVLYCVCKQYSTVVRYLSTLSVRATSVMALVHNWSYPKSPQGHCYRTEQWKGG